MVPLKYVDRSRQFGDGSGVILLYISPVGTLRGARTGAALPEHRRIVTLVFRLHPLFSGCPGRLQGLVNIGSLNVGGGVGAVYVVFVRHRGPQTPAVV